MKYDYAGFDNFQDNFQRALYDTINLPTEKVKEGLYKAVATSGGWAYYSPWLRENKERELAQKAGVKEIHYYLFGGEQYWRVIEHPPVRLLHDIQHLKQQLNLKESIIQGLERIVEIQKSQIEELRSKGRKEVKIEARVCDNQIGIIHMLSVIRERKKEYRDIIEESKDETPARCNYYKGRLQELLELRQILLQFM